MQPYQPSRVPDQRTNCRFNEAQLDELNRRHIEKLNFNPKPSTIAKEVKARIDRKKKKAPEK